MIREREVTCFEDFMMKMHAESIQYTEDDCLDDDLVDAFDEWMALMDESVKDMYVDLYGKFMHVQGYKECMADSKKTLERIGTK